MNSNYAHLPPHIIVNILKILNLNDFKNAVQVCKTWYNASCCSTIGVQITIHLAGDIPNTYKCIKRPFNILKLTQVNFNRWNYRNFLKKFSHSIRELHITRCTITFNRLGKCLKYLTNLEMLRIEMRGDTKFKLTKKSCSNLKNSLPNIKTFLIECFAEQCGGLNFILGKCIKLRQLSYYTHSSQNLYDNSKVHVDMWCAMARWPHVDLESLEIVNRATDITSFFTSFCQLNQVTVKKLKLLEIPSDYDRDEFKKFCIKLGGIEELEMGSVNDLDLETICEYMPNLRLLGVHKFHGRQLGVVGGSINLEILNVIARPFRYQDHLVQFATARMPNLMILELARVKISLEILNLLCANFTNLIKLELYLDTYDCSAIFKYQQKLKVLHLYFWDTCPETLDDISTEYTCLHLTQLRYLIITKYVPGLTAELISKMKCLENFEYLVDFNIRDVRNFRYDDNIYRFAAGGRRIA